MNLPIEEKKPEPFVAPETEKERADRLWKSLTPLEQKVALAYTEYGCGWKTCVREFDLDSREHLYAILHRIAAKLGGGDLKRYTGSRRHQWTP